MKPIDNEYDCIVMGGGPAGSTVATLVAKAGFRTLLVERDRFPRRHVGESLMPDSYFVFERLGMLEKLKQSGYAKKVGVQFVNHKGRESAPFLFRWNDPRECSETWHVPRPRVRPDAVRERGRERRRLPPGRARARRADGGRSRRRRAVASTTGRRRGRGKAARATCGPRSSSTPRASRPSCRSKLGLRRVNPDLKKAAIWGHFRGAIAIRPTAASTRSSSTPTSAKAGSGTSRRPTTW